MLVLFVTLLYWVCCLILCPCKTFYRRLSNIYFKVYIFKYLTIPVFITFIRKVVVTSGRSRFFSRLESWHEKNKCARTARLTAMNTNAVSHSIFHVWALRCCFPVNEMILDQKETTWTHRALGDPKRDILPPFRA